MKDSIEEFGMVMVGCIIGVIAVLGLTILTQDGGLFASFAEAYADYFYGAEENINLPM